MENQINVVNWVTIPGLYDAGYRAYSGISFSPEKRAEQTVKDYEQELNEDLKNIPDDEKEQYVSNYKKYLFAWLSAMSRCYSSMISGSSNFPVSRMEKLNSYEHNRSVEFSGWREKALSEIAKNVEDSKQAEQKTDEMFLQFKKQVDRLFEGWGVTNFKGRLETVAKSGNTELVTKVLDYLKFMQVEKNRVLATSRNSIWSLADISEKNRKLSIDKETAESKEYQINGINVVENIQEDRIQLFFDGKPESEMIQNLKRNAFKWSPSRSCWQRQLTMNAIHATKNLLK